jgi:tRNA(fMet)-specific endonuclease VapC
MSSAFLLDTNAVILYMNNDETVKVLVDKASELFLSVIALGELYFGAENSSKQLENVQKVENFSKNITILACDGETAKWYGRVHKQLRDIGQPIPQNDIWIAAIALQHGLTLLTKDKHFDNVVGLKKQSW